MRSSKTVMSRIVRQIYRSDHCGSVFHQRLHGSSARLPAVRCASASSVWRCAVYGAIACLGARSVRNPRQQTTSQGHPCYRPASKSAIDHYGTLTPALPAA